MSVFRNSLYKCPECEIVTEVLIELPDGIEARYENYPPTHECGACGSMAYKIMGAPAIHKVSYRDGVFRGEGFQLTKEIAKLKLKRKDAKGSERAEINKQINDLQKTIVKKSYKSI